MSFRQQFLAVAAVVCCLLNSNHSTSAQARFAVSNLSTLKAIRYSPQPLPLPDISKLSELQKAYLDAYSILSQSNACSEFFGGPPSISVLNELIAQLRPSHLDKLIGIRMSGATTIVTNAQTKFNYRLFNKAEVNLNGAFYRGNDLPFAPTIPKVARFLPNTREARVTILLHELGHLVRKRDGGWLLPDDGKDISVSGANTDRIADVCGQQIRVLHNSTFAEEFVAMQSQPIDEAVVRAP